MISDSTAKSAARFLFALPLLTQDERRTLLSALLEVAHAEGAQHIVHSMAAVGEAASALDKARRTTA
jgi:hypothetical protein